MFPCNKTTVQQFLSSEHQGTVQRAVHCTWNRLLLTYLMLERSEIKDSHEGWKPNSKPSIYPQRLWPTTMHFLKWHWLFKPPCSECCEGSEFLNTTSFCAALGGLISKQALETRMKLLTWKKNTQGSTTDRLEVFYSNISLDWPRGPLAELN